MIRPDVCRYIIDSDDATLSDVICIFKQLPEGLSRCAVFSDQGVENPEVWQESHRYEVWQVDVRASQRLCFVYQKAWSAVCLEWVGEEMLWSDCVEMESWKPQTGSTRTCQGSPGVSQAQMRLLQAMVSPIVSFMLPHKLTFHTDGFLYDNTINNNFLFLIRLTFFYLNSSIPQHHSLSNQS